MYNFEIEMSYAGHAKNILAAINELKANRVKETTLMILDEIALIKRRVINEGKNSDGGGFEPYSPHYLKVRQKRKMSTFRNFTFTTAMWKSVVAKIIANTDVSTTYVIGSQDPELQERIDINKDRSGDFLKMSDEEQNLLHELNRQRVFKVLQKHNVI
jgi:hypothetical protein